MVEEWRPVSGYENSYLVSNLGRVRSRTRKIAQGNRWGGTTVKSHKGQLLALHPDRTGCYLQVVLYEKDRKDKCCLVHILVCTAFNGPKPGDGYEVNHKDGVKANNVFTNLEWGSYTYNRQHAFRTGLHVGNPDYITDDVAEDIRSAVASGETQTSIAARVGCSQPAVSYTINHRAETEEPAT